MRLLASAADGRQVVTLDGTADAAGYIPVSKPGSMRAPQCGYCENGQIMTSFAFLALRPEAEAAEIEAAMDGVLNRCGTQSCICKAIERGQSAMA